MVGGHVNYYLQTIANRRSNQTSEKLPKIRPKHFNLHFNFIDYKRDKETSRIETHTEQKIKVDFDEFYHKLRSPDHNV